MNIFAILALFGLPWIILKASSKVKLIDWLSPVVCCYAVGIILGNIFGNAWPTGISKEVTEISIMFSLPLLLFSTNLIGWFRLAKTTIISYSLLCLAVCMMAYVGGKLFAHVSPEAWKMAGMMVGVYVGGTANMSAIGRALNVQDETFVILNGIDVVLGGIYLLFIMSLGLKILTWALPAFKSTKTGEEEESFEEAAWTKLSGKMKAIRFSQQILLAGLCVGIAAGTSLLIFGELVVATVVLVLTSCAILISMVPKLRNLEGGQEWGNYFLLVFCVAIGSMANIANMMNANIWYFIYMGFVMMTSIILHFLFCFFLKIDRDTALITSTAGIYGPAFVPPIAQVLKNREMLVSGVTTGLVGLAIGNFLGIGLAYLLK